jgi:hypothetical protein
VDRVVPLTAAWSRRCSPSRVPRSTTASSSPPHLRRPGALWGRSALVLAVVGTAAADPDVSPISWAAVAVMNAPAATGGMDKKVTPGVDEDPAPRVPDACPSGSRCARAASGNRWRRARVGSAHQRALGAAPATIEEKTSCKIASRMVIAPPDGSFAPSIWDMSASERRVWRGRIDTRRREQC